MEKNDHNGLTNTMTLAEFKKSRGVDKLEFKTFREGKRPFATLPDGVKIFMSANIDRQKDMFVSIGKFGAYWLHNI